MYDVLKYKKILSVDDNPDNQRYAECNLLKENVKFLTVSNGSEALDILNKEKVDIILMDLYMPQMNGVECIKKIRNELNLKTPIIVITAGLIDLHNEISPLINGSLEKPYRKTQLLNIIIKTLEKVEN